MIIAKGTYLYWAMTASFSLAQLLNDSPSSSASAYSSSSSSKPLSSSASSSSSAVTLDSSTSATFLDEVAETLTSSQSSTSLSSPTSSLLDSSRVSSNKDGKSTLTTSSSPLLSSSSFEDTSVNSDLSLKETSLTTSATLTASESSLNDASLSFSDVALDSAVPGIKAPDLEEICKGCSLEIAYEPLFYPFNVEVTTITATIMTMITEYDNGTVTNFITSTMDNASAILAEANTTVSEPLTWEVSGFTLTYPTNYRLYDFLAEFTTVLGPNSASYNDDSLQSNTLDNAASPVFTCDTVSITAPENLASDALLFVAGETEGPLASSFSGPYGEFPYFVSLYEVEEQLPGQDYRDCTFAVAAPLTTIVDEMTTVAYLTEVSVPPSTIRRKSSSPTPESNDGLRDEQGEEGEEGEESEENEGEQRDPARNDNGVGNSGITDNESGDRESEGNDSDRNDNPNQGSFSGVEDDAGGGQGSGTSEGEGADARQDSSGVISSSDSDDRATGSNEGDNDGNGGNNNNPNPSNDSNGIGSGIVGGSESPNEPASSSDNSGSDVSDRGSSNDISSSSNGSGDSGSFNPNGGDSETFVNSDTSSSDNNDESNESGGSSGADNGESNPGIMNGSEDSNVGIDANSNGNDADSNGNNNGGADILIVDIGDESFTVTPARDPDQSIDESIAAEAGSEDSKENDGINDNVGGGQNSDDVENDSISDDSTRAEGSSSSEDSNGNNNDNFGDDDMIEENANNDGVESDVADNIIDDLIVNINPINNELSDEDGIGVGNDNGFMIGNQTLSPGETVTINNVPVALLPTGNSLVIDGTRTELIPFGAGQSGSNDGVVSVATAAPVVPFTVDSFAATISNSQLIVGAGTILAPGEVVTVDGTRISLGEDGNAAVVGTNTINIASLAETAPSVTSPAAAAFESSALIPITIDSLTATISNLQLIVGPGTALTAGEAVTIDGTPVSLDNQGAVAVVGTSTINLESIIATAAATAAAASAITPAPSIAPITIDSLTATISDSQLIISPGRTLTPGAIATIDGTRISLDEDGSVAVIGTSTVDFSSVLATAAATSANANVIPITLDNSIVLTATITDGASLVLGPGRTLAPGEVITLDGTRISVGGEEDDGIGISTGIGTVFVGSSVIEFATVGPSETASTFIDDGDEIFDPLASETAVVVGGDDADADADADADDATAPLFNSAAASPTTATTISPAVKYISILSAVLSLSWSCGMRFTIFF